MAVFIYIFYVWRLTVFVVKDQATLMTSLYQFTLSELVLDYDLPITVHVAPSPRVHISFQSAQLNSAHLHHLCGTTFRLN